MEWLKNQWPQIRQIFGEPDEVKAERLLAARTTILPVENSSLGEIHSQLNGRRPWLLADPENGPVDQLTVLIIPRQTIRGISMGNLFYVPRDSFRFSLQIVNDQNERERTDTYESQLLDLDKNRVWREGIRGRDPRLGNPDA